MILRKQNEKRVTVASIWVKIMSENSNTLAIEHSLLNSPIILPRYGFQFSSKDLPDKLHSKDSVSICKQISYDRALFKSIFWQQRV